jgi:chorismate mutase
MECTEQSMKIPYYTLGIGFSLHFWLTRHRMDMIDDEIYKLVQKRLELSEKVHHYRNNLLYDAKFREEYVLDRLKKKKMIADAVVEEVWRPLVKHEKQ